MKLLRTVALFAICLTALLSAAGCSEKGTESFNAVITEITEDGITARPFEDEEILKKASVIRLDQSVLSANPVPDFLPGDTARIVWNGKVKKGEPASLEHVFAVYSLPPLYSEELFNARNEYIGDAPADGRLLGLLAEYFNIEEKRSLELQTSGEPYTMTVHFESEPDLRRMSQTACSLLALIGNCGEIRWDYLSKGSDVKEGVSITTADAEELLQLEDLKKYGETEESLHRLLENIVRLTEINR